MTPTAAIRSIFEMAPNAHLLKIEPNDKCPKKGTLWRKHPLSQDDAIAWIEAGHRLGIVPASANAGVVDIDNGGEESLNFAKSICGDPVAIVETGSHTPDSPRWHCIYSHDPSVHIGNAKWIGGDLRVDAGYVVVWDMGQWADAIAKIAVQAIPPADIAKLKTAQPTGDSNLVGLSFDQGLHPRALEEIGHAIRESETWDECVKRIDAIVKAHAERRRARDGDNAKTDEKLKSEMAAWNVAIPKWWKQKIENAAGGATWTPQAESEQTEIAVMCQAPHGTIQSWQEAATKLGFRFRYNTLNESGQVLIPLRFESEANGGGQWKQIDDIARSTVVASIEAHAMAYTVGKKPYLKGVFLPKEKSRDAITSLFAANRFCPFKEYLDGLPKWCGKPIIGKSMERGGMYVDAGIFTESVQSYPWIFAVRNTLFPGSSNREHIVLHGPHNSGKSKFVKEMLPTHLREYYNEAFSLDGSLKVKLERSMGKILMECGEFGQGGPKDWNAVKQWLTLSEVSGERLAYKEYARRHRLTATTIFTTNTPELPPTEEAVLSRFIWVNVKTPATTLDGLVWTHFDSYYDAEHPEMGTWRDQYFAEALHIVNEHIEKVEHQTGGAKQISYRSNPKWLPKDHIPALIEWNKNAGGTFTTEVGDLVVDTIQAIELLRDWYEQMSIDNRNFFPTAELIHAIVCVRDGVDYSDWWELARDAKGDPLSGEARRKSEVERAVSPIKLANAMPAVGVEMGAKFIKKQKKWKTDNRSQPVRGFEMEWPEDE